MGLTDAKPLASLSSGLLARKGQARPAMRRQGFDTLMAPGPAALDDLGWNDMGDDAPPSPAREQYQQLREQVEQPAREPVWREGPVNPAALLTPEPRSAAPAPKPERAPAPAPVAEIAAEVRVDPVEAAPSPADPARTVPPIAVRRARREAASRAGKTATGKAAFTLRLDAERHLKLRLAAALERTSAQALVTRALDQFLDGLPGLAPVLGRLPDHKD